MTSIHYFQRYSQPENVATNNTLLLLSRLYQIAPIKFKGFINDLLDDINFEAGINFNQQNKNSGKSKSVPDGSLNQSSFKVIIETKLHKKFDIKQLRAHLDDFGLEENQILLSLSPKKPENSLRDKIKSEVHFFNQKNNKSIKYIPICFKDIVDKFRSIQNDYEFELINMIDDFEGYCIQDHLIVNDEDRMRVVPCGWTLDENLKYNLYYDPADRGYSDHSFLGIYKDKSVRGIGKIENIITADLTNGNLKITEASSEVTDKQKINIVTVMGVAKQKNNWNIEKGHKFFCVEQFFETDFRKKTKYPLQGTKLFNLKETLNLTNIPDTETIAELLKKTTW